MTTAHQLPFPAHATVAAAVSRGKRAYQHDRHTVHAEASSGSLLLAVADGHGAPAIGHVVSDFVASRLVPFLQGRGALSAPSTSEAADNDTYTYTDTETDTDTEVEKNYYANERFEKPLADGHSQAQGTADDRIAAAVADLDAASIAHAEAAGAPSAGSTLCLVLLSPAPYAPGALASPPVLRAANVGDSRAVAISAAGRARPLTTDHVASNGRERARAVANGAVFVGPYLNGHVSVTRGLGDADLKAGRNETAFVAHGARPYGDRLFVGDAEVGATDRLRADEIGVLVGSDGLFGALSNDDVAAALVRALAKGHTLQKAAQGLVKSAERRGARDNITVVVALAEGEDAARAQVLRVAAVGRAEGARRAGRKAKGGARCGDSSSGARESRKPGAWAITSTKMKRKRINRVDAKDAGDGDVVQAEARKYTASEAAASKSGWSTSEGGAEGGKTEGARRGWWFRGDVVRRVRRSVLSS